MAGHSPPGDDFAFLDDVTAVAVAVSGGSDSLALLHLVAEARLRRRPALRLWALTVDHGLRPEAAAEAEQVAAWCAALAVPHVILRWEGEKPRSAIQARARAARYRLLADWCRGHDVPVLLTGHTREDQAETVLMRQRRTTSALSLAGIWGERTVEGVRLLRPLLHRRRAELRQMLAARGQGWIDDPANEQVRFERVRLRRELAAASVDPLLAQAAAAQRQTLAAAARANEVLKRHGQISALGYAQMARQGLAELDGLAAEMLMEALLRGLGGGRGAEAARRRALLDWLGTRGAGRRTLAGALVVKRQRDIVVLREPGRMAPFPEALPAGGRMDWDGRFRLIGAPGTEVAMARQGHRPARVPAALHLTLPELRGDGQRVFVGLQRLEDTIYERVMLGIALSPSYL